MNLYTYDTLSYPFRKLFCDLLSEYELEYLHNEGGFENVGNTPGNDNNSFWHHCFYDEMKESLFIDCYNDFMNEAIRPQFSEKIVYQKYPTLRIQIPDGKGVAAYHIDSEYNHPIEETNIWLPFTHAKDSSSIYIESKPGKGDYTPQDVDYGQYITFDGCRLSHGNEINKTGQTRVSIDMRVIPFSKFKPSKMKGLSYGKERTTSGKNAYYGVIK